MNSSDISVAEKVEIAERLKRSRLSMGIQQDDVKSAGQATVSQWENGKIPDNLLQFAELALEVGQSPDTLLLTNEDDAPLTRSRKGLPDVLRDNLIHITMLLEKMDRAAQGQGSGPLPSTIFKEHLEGLSELLGLQPPAPGAAPEKSARLLPPVTEYHRAQLELIRAIKAGSLERLRAAGETVALLLGRTTAVLSPPDLPKSPKDSGVTTSTAGPASAPRKPKRRRS